MRVIEFNIETDASGDFSATQTIPGLAGEIALIYAVEWVVGDLATGVDFDVISDNELSGVEDTVLSVDDANANATYYPRHTEHDSAGAELSTSTLPVTYGDIKLTVAQGGNGNTGQCLVYVLV